MPFEPQPLVCVLRRAAFQAAAATNCHEAQKKPDALKAVEAAAAKMAALLSKHIQTGPTEGSGSQPRWG